MSALHELISRYVMAIDDIDSETGEVPPEVAAALDALAPLLEQKIEALFLNSSFAWYSWIFIDALASKV